MRAIAGLLSICLAFGAVAFAEEAAEEKQAEAKIEAKVDSEAMVVKINDQIIREKDVALETDKRMAAQAQRMPPGMEIDARMRNQIRSSVVDMLVEAALLEQKLAAKEIEVADEDVMKEIEKIAAQQNMKLEDVPTEIARYGMTMDDLKRQIRMTVQRDKLIEAEMEDKEVKDEDVKTFYDENPQFFERPEQVRVAHVLILTQGKGTEERVAARAKIEEVLKKAKAGETFAALAKEYSEDPGSKDQGGEYTFPRGQMVPAFEESAFTLKDGEISDVVETEYGYHVLKKLEHLEAHKEPFDSVKDNIKGHLDRQKRGQFWESYSEKMRQEAKIEYSETEKKLRQAAQQPSMMPF